MAQTHSFGPTCVYYESDNEDETTTSSAPPKVKAQFFYVAALPIDDPLSPVPPVSAEQSESTPPQPFSARDNAALEEAWQGLRDAQHDFAVRPGSRGLQRMFSFPKFREGSIPTPEMTSPVAETFNPLSIPDLQSRAYVRSGTSQSRKSRKSSSRSHSPEMKRRPSDRVASLQARMQMSSESDVLLNQEMRVSDVSAEQTSHRDARSTSTRRSKHLSPLPSQPRDRDGQSRDGSPTNTKATSPPQPPQDPNGLDSSVRADVNSTISGRPFARAPSKRQLSASALLRAFDPPPEQENSQPVSAKALLGEPSPSDKKSVFVPVGVSRLHLVELPDLTMKPIYWPPINDISTVMRATWFYKDSMLPVPAKVANRLEIGYEDLKPYLDTYQDELNACIEHGAAAELKIVHKLWPANSRTGRSAADLPDKIDEEELDPVDLAVPSQAGNAAADPRPKNKAAKMFHSHSVIYIDAKNAQILRPSSLPSVSKNRRPLGPIRKGRQLGVAVVRGFDRQTWLKLRPDAKRSTRTSHAKTGAQMSRSGDATTQGSAISCQICQEGNKRQKATDLVLVIHGIGQKLSERVDSYHFTHAINGLRREFNVQLSEDSTQGSLKPNSGIMVLPVNWRLTVSFEDDSWATQARAENKYKLKDITPETLPAVRSMISDVMLDIPYYMSHHKQKMIAAVVREANRVYRLWCRNNPGFEEYGRVHLIAHSLGSAMATDILSHQPTYIPADLDLNTPVPSDEMFEFNTTNLFCCGSPSGFFLLLNGANLIPRKGRRKPGVENEEPNEAITGDIGRYGCLAVDNIYNIMHKNDPITYQQNACVDSTYASLLQPATIPSATQHFFTRLGNSFRWSSTATASATDAYGHAAVIKRPAAQSMPSNVELETHNFTREEIAEQRMYLLNDNGQIDFFLQSGGGPLEIQYLNMLSAHSSYWILQDFVRFLVVEIGREPGRENTLPVLRAVKKREYKRGEAI